MYTVIIGDKSMEFKTKEELIGYFVSKEHLFNINPETYVPSVFREVALNSNDRRTVFDFHGDYLFCLSEPDKVQRSVMAFDGDHRVVDIRSWLPEFRAAMKERINSTSKTVWFGCSGAKPKFRKTYRVARGIKQRMSLREQIDMEEVDRIVGTLPAKMLRQYRPEKNFAKRDDCCSWKEQSKCRKSWQRRSGQPSARKLHEMDWQSEIDSIEETLIAEAVQEDILPQAG